MGSVNDIQQIKPVAEVTINQYVTWTYLNMGTGPGQEASPTGANGMIRCNSNFWWNGKGEGIQIAIPNRSLKYTFKANQTNAWFNMGLGSAAAIQDSGACIELCWQIKGNARAEVWESGVRKSALDAFVYTTATVFEIRVLRTGVVTYLMEGVLKYTSLIDPNTIASWAIRPNTTMGFFGGDQTGASHTPTSQANECYLQSPIL